MRSPIGLADLVRAVAELAPRGDDPLAIARLLGMAEPVVAPVKVGEPAVKSARTAITGSGNIAVGGSRLTATGTVTSASTTPSAAPATGTGPVTLRPLGRRAGEVPAWLEDDDRPLVLRPPAAPGAPIETLFEPRRHRALLGAALATVTLDGPLDLDRAIALVATRRLGADLPRLAVATLRRGAWLLLDRSPAMAPFFADVTDLAARIESVIGRDIVRTQRFTVGPRQVWDDEALDERPIELPPAGTPLVALTDLGLRSGDDRAWRDVLGRLRARGSPAIAIVPYPPARWPRALDKLATIVPWDRSTGVGAARIRARGRT